MELHRRVWESFRLLLGQGVVILEQKLSSLIGDGDLARRVGYKMARESASNRKESKS